MKSGYRIKEKATSVVHLPTSRGLGRECLYCYLFDMIFIYKHLKVIIVRNINDSVIRNT